MLAFLIVLLAVLAAALVLALRRLSGARTGEVTATAALEGERRLREQLESSHRSQLADLQRVTAEKVELLSGNREQFRQEMQAISSEVLQGATRQMTELA